MLNWYSRKQRSECHYILHLLLIESHLLFVDKSLESERFKQMSIPLWNTHFWFEILIHPSSTHFKVVLLYINFHFFIYEFITKKFAQANLLIRPLMHILRMYGINPYISLRTDLELFNNPTTPFTCIWKLGMIFLSECHCAGWIWTGFMDYIYVVYF